MVKTTLLLDKTSPASGKRKQKKKDLKVGSGYENEGAQLYLTAVKYFLYEWK